MHRIAERVGENAACWRCRISYAELKMQRSPLNFTWSWGGILLLVMASFTTSADAQIIVGHRGASHDAPENTLAAFRLAFDQGADGVEGDFYVTADQQIVCIHDKTTKRTGGESLDVANTSLEQLRRLEYGSWFNESFRGEPIPTFREVLDVIPAGKWFVIELKTGPEIVPLLKQELQRASRNDVRMLIIAFDTRTVQACKRELPEYTVHWLTGFKQQQDAWLPTMQQVIQTVQQTGADGVGFQDVPEAIHEQAVRQLREAKIDEFHVWTIDQPTQARYFQSLGAIGITTNRPRLLRDSLKASP